jgi:hypothetical protein
MDAGYITARIFHLKWQMCQFCSLLTVAYEWVWIINKEAIPQNFKKTVPASWSSDETDIL